MKKPNIGIHPAYLENTSIKIQKTSNAICVIARVLNENQIAEDTEEGQRFNGYIAGGLYNAIELLAESLTEMGAHMETYTRELENVGGAHNG